MIKKNKARLKIEVSDSNLAKSGHTRESYENLSKGGRWSVRNRAKHYAMCKTTVAKKPEQYSIRHRKYYLKSLYNLTEKDYTDMLTVQKGRCAIC